ncbi:hypothetical protein AsAng_0005840 [Aureispira anguillae]|uniref:Uncharacterized protein n=1 Tax=Aureispira anguillae TaxID=2864201 RepID=A0A916DNH0_9BACT|nr:hypothetical protein AsAng_0005840 [Aureispira anguillae]
MQKIVDLLPQWIINFILGKEGIPLKEATQ